MTMASDAISDGTARGTADWNVTSDSVATVNETWSRTSMPSTWSNATTTTTNSMSSLNSTAWVANITDSMTNHSWYSLGTDSSKDKLASDVSSVLSTQMPTVHWMSETTTNVTDYVTELFSDVTSGSFLDIYDQTTTPVVGAVTAATTPASYVIPDLSYAGVSLQTLVLKTATLVLIALSGALANGFIIYTIVKEGNLHRPPFYYLLSLCVSDLSRSVFCIPLVFMTVLQGSVWKHGSSACKLFAFANSFFVYSSCAALAAISVDRYFSIVYSKLYRRRSRGLVNLIVVVVGWTIAFAMSFPPVIGIGTYVFIPEESQCTFHHKYYKSNDTLGFILVFSLIVFVSVFLYLRVFAFLRKHRRMRPLEHQPAKSANWTFFGPGANGQALLNIMNGFGANPAINPLRMQVRPNFGRVVNLHTVKNEHLTRLFFLVTCAFSVFWSPYIILAFWRMFSIGGNIQAVFVTISAWLTYTQVALCPLTYIVSRGPIRKHSRTVVDANDKKEFLLEARNRK